MQAPRDTARPKFGGPEIITLDTRTGPLVVDRHAAFNRPAAVLSSLCGAGFSRDGRSVLNFADRMAITDEDLTDPMVRMAAVEAENKMRRAAAELLRDNQRAAALADRSDI